MYKYASFAAPLATAAGFDGREAQAGSGPRPPSGLTWRHLATSALLLVALPMFALAAVISLPVLLLGGAGQGLRAALVPRQGREREPGSRSH